MKTTICLCLLLSMLGCSKTPETPDPKIAVLEYRVKVLEEDLAKTKTYLLSVGQSQETGDALTKTQGEIIMQMAPADNVEQLKSLLLQHSELNRKRNELIDQKLKVLSEAVFHNPDKN